MMRTLDWNTYLDKVYGCFLGKAVVGTMGAPFEGVKMPMNVPFNKSMIDAMLPNDDLDLQIIWMDVCEDIGPDFTSAQLLERFCENCDYSPGEYAVMRRNWQKKILPPLSGRFGNDNYLSGMGCPIRSEIWACLAPGDGDRAAAYAYRDGCLDHEGASIHAEQFLAALEAEAFFQSDMDALIASASRFIPKGSRLERLVKDTLDLCAQSDDVQWIFRRIHAGYGHPDCTNMYQNIAIILIVLKKSGLDFVKTGMDALNCGFDTDCTCATAGAIIGTVMGAKAAIAKHDLGDVKYVLSVRAKDRGDRIEDLALAVAKLGLRFMKSVKSDVVIAGAPEAEPYPPCRPALDCRVEYANGDPSIGFGETKQVTVRVTNTTHAYLRESVALDAPAGFSFDLSADTLSVDPGCTREVIIPITCGADNVYLNEKNLFTLRLIGDAEQDVVFGLSGNTVWKVTGSYWETDPYIHPDSLSDGKRYYALFPPAKSENENVDAVRTFHLNTYPNLDREYVDAETLFLPLGTEGRNVDAARFDMKEDALRMEELFGMEGPCTAYLSRVVTAPEDMEVCLQVGHTCPFTLWLNGVQIAKQNNCQRWTNENVHLTGLRLRKGENRMILRFTRVNDDAKISMTFSKQASCSEYITDLGCKNPEKF